MTEQDKRGTGKHGHKDTQEPYPHHGASKEQQGQGSQQRSGGESSQQSGSSSSRSEEESLKAREYRDEQGNVHHHTKTYMDEHGNEQGGRK